jgi:carboxypeptidase Q
MRVRITLFTLVFTLLSFCQFALAQEDPIVAAIIKEANENSQLKRMSHELMDGIGPRLVGSTKMMQASDWAIAQYQQYGISARRENYGTWRGWDLSLIHI